MRSFFKGWRRKTGVVTLVMACVFAGEWMRSYERHDRVIVFFPASFHTVYSHQGCLVWQCSGHRRRMNSV